VRTKENYRNHFLVGSALTFVTVILFQFYTWREPGRIQGAESLQHEAAVEAGAELFSENCASCHGKEGQGGVGPALNSRTLLKSTLDEVISSLIRTGIPGTQMPAWSQAYGGPFTDEQISQIVSFIRAWETTAPEIKIEEQEPDPVRGAEIYSQTCFICHGENGVGNTAPALNDLERLQDLDDSWYRNVILRGRPARGMPTWETVLSPSQVDDVVALLAAWREGETVELNTPLATFVTNAIFAIREFDREDALFYLDATLEIADNSQKNDIKEVIALVEENQLFSAESKLIGLLPPTEMGRAAFRTNCAPCHGDDGLGEKGPNLHDNPFIQSQNDQDMLNFILTGRRGTGMDGFDGVLGEDEINNIIALLREWQE